MTTRWAYLGPPGTFTEEALDALLARPSATGPDEGAGHERIPQASVDAALGAVRRGEADAAVVPLENSVEGGVSATLDALATGDPLVITGEVLVPVRFVLAACPGTALADVRVVGSHPHAIAQCRGWLSANLPGATTAVTLSTAAAATALTGGGPGGGQVGGPVGGPGGHDAALCSRGAAQSAGLVVLADDVADRAGAVTRFVAVRGPGHLPEPSGADRTTVVAYQREDVAGSLLALLEQFATRGVNLSRIDSRPLGTALGQYCFSIDCDGHVADPRVGEALTGLRRVTADLRFLGSYPRADGLAPSVPPGTSDADFVAASAWLEAQRSGAPDRPGAGPPSVAPSP